MKLKQNNHSINLEGFWNYLNYAGYFFGERNASKKDIKRIIYDCNYKCQIQPEDHF